jgi:hypothetical protein
MQGLDAAVWLFGCLEYLGFIGLETGISVTLLRSKLSVSTDFCNWN